MLPVHVCHRTPRTLHGVLELAAQRSPHALAIVGTDEQLTYAQLNARANALARHLIELGASRGQLVAIHLERSIDLVISALAVCKAHAAYLPLAVEQPAQRIRFMIDDARAGIVITRQSLAAHVEGTGAYLLDIDAAQAALARLPSTNPDLPVQPDDLAFCIYTSGSTGQPKGVLVQHTGIAALVEAQQQAFQVNEHDRVLQFASFGFDAFVFDLLMAFGSSAALVLRGDALGDRFIEDLRRQQVTIATLPPSLLARTDLRSVGSLRCVIAAGEACPATNVRSVAPACAFFNAYGPTEATIWATAFKASHEAVGGDTMLSIGHAIGRTDVHLLQPDLTPVTQAGEVGEIHLSGEALARGYLARADLTAQSFIPNPFGAPGSRMYKTGDLARRLADGSLQFLGRVDHQVKVNGHRIELGEVESALLRCPGVREAAVFVREDQDGGKHLVAAVVVPNLGDAALTAWREALGTSLPAYMVPGEWALLDSLPLNPSGKVDRHALATVKTVRASSSQGAANEASSPIERTVAGIWAQVLSLESVSLADAFRHLGGTSIQAIDVSHRLASALKLGRNAPLPLGNMTVREHAALVERLLADAAAPSHEEADASATPSLASYAQQQVCFMEQLGDAWRAYRCHARFVFRGPLQPQRLEAAIQRLIDRHEIIRTGFVQHGGVWHREVQPSLPFSLRVFDAQAQPEALESCLAAELDHRFDISKPPLIRWLLVRLAPDHHVLWQTEHHTVHDGLSFRLIVRDLAEFYNASLQGRDAELPAVHAQYSEYCLDEQRWFASAEFDTQLQAWHRHLGPYLQDLRLFTNRQPESPVRRHLGAQHRQTFDSALMAQVAALCVQHGVSQYVFMLSVFAALCAKLSGQHRFLIGSALANRSTGKYQGTVGMFVNMLPIPFEVDSGMSFAGLLRQGSRHTDFALSNGSVPLGEIVRSMGLSARLNGEAPFNVGFSFHNSMPASPHFEGLDVVLEEALGNGSSKFDLSVVGIVGNACSPHPLELIFEYNTDLFDRETIERMAGHYQTLLKAVVEQPQRKLRDVQLMDSQQLHQVLVQFNDTAAEHSQECCVHELFEQQVAAQPHAVAVVHADQQFSYAQLNERANQLAHALRTMGVGPDMLVALCLRRSVDLVVAVLGVLKAGAAYVPLDPQHPPQRLGFMLRDTAASVLLTQQEFVPLLLAHDARTVLMDDASLASQPSHNPAPLAKPHHLAYCIYTSGSTGHPKGVLIESRSAVNLATWHREKLGVGPTDRVLQFANFAFDAATWEILGALCAGAELNLAPGNNNLSGSELLDFIRERGITVAFLPTPILEVLASGGDPLPANLRLLLTGGDRLRVHPSPSNTVIVNNYGPTEVTVVSTSGVLDAEDASRLPSIGRPIRNIRAHVLDEDLQPVPAGVAGELHLCGDGLARGYLGRPELTAEKFLPNPFGAPGTRMYKTGDLARHLPDGRLEFLGRIDHQVKVRGYRIEPGEIEVALLSHPAVQAAVVEAIETPPGDRQLAAYVATADSGLAPATLRDHLEPLVPSYMVPSAWALMQALPLNPNGKIDRKALARLDVQVAEAASPVHESVTQAATPELSAVLKVLAELLPGVAIAPTDDLFSKGVHSILMMRFVARCRDELGVQLRLRDIYRLSSPAAIAQAIIESKVHA